MRETYIDHVSGHACPAGTLYPGNYCASSGQPQHVSKTYMFNNRYGSARSAGTEITTASKVTGPKDSSGRYPAALRENYEYWLPNSSCSAKGTCSWGIGCGESVPIGTCTTGTAYWVTSNSARVPIWQIDRGISYQQHFRNSLPMQLDEQMDSLLYPVHLSASFTIRGS